MGCLICTISVISTPSITLKKKLEIYIELQIRFVSFKILNLAEEVAASRVKLEDTHTSIQKKKGNPIFKVGILANLRPL